MQDVNSITGFFDTFIQYKQRNDPPRSYAHYHPSEFGKCLRKAQYSLYADMGLIEVDKEPNRPQLQRIFDTGHSMHDRWAKYAEEAGVLRGVWCCANPKCGSFDDDGKYNEELRNKSRVYGRDEKHGCFKPEVCLCGNRRFHYWEASVDSKELNIKGHVDMILDFSKINKDSFKGIAQAFDLDELPKTPVVIDMKTANSNSFKKVSFQGPHDYYITQLTIYAHLLECEYGVLIYENKNDGAINAFKVPIDEDKFATITTQSMQLQKLVEHKQLPPPKPETKATYECKNCQFRKMCHSSKIWKDPNINKYRQDFYRI